MTTTYRGVEGAAPSSTTGDSEGLLDSEGMSFRWRFFFAARLAFVDSPAARGSPSCFRNGSPFLRVPFGLSHQRGSADAPSVSVDTSTRTMVPFSKSISACETPESAASTEESCGSTDDGDSYRLAGAARDRIAYRFDIEL